MKKNPLLKKILFLCCLFTFSYIGGTSIRYLVNQNQVSQTAASQEGNWGLSFRKRAQPLSEMLPVTSFPLIMPPMWIRPRKK